VPSSLRPILTGFSCLLISTGLAIGCASTPIVTQPAGQSLQPTIVATAVPAPTVVATLEHKPTMPTIGAGNQALVAGTYRLELAVAPTVLNKGFPALQVTVPQSWNSLGGWILNRGGLNAVTVAVQFWNVDQVYGHPCQWSGTLFQPGPTVDGLSKALFERPLRHAMKPIDVMLDGYAGKYLEWSVPADADFSKCDADAGTNYFESWIGPPGSDRYQQAPGQVDSLWILDVDGSRVVIDAFSMPAAAAEERQELRAVVESIRFER